MHEIIAWAFIVFLTLASVALGMVEVTRIVFAEVRRTPKVRRVEIGLRAWWVFLPLTLIAAVLASAATTWVAWPGLLVFALLSTLVVATATRSLRPGGFTFVAFVPSMLTQFVFETCSPSRYARIDPFLIWLVLMACSIGFLALAYGVGLRSWARRVYMPDACPECGYDVRGLPQDVCPECGTEGVVAHVEG